MTAVDWDALVTRTGVRPPAEAQENDALRSVRRAVPRLSGTTPDTEIALTLLTAASSGELRERLTDTQARSSQSRSALKSQARAGASDPIVSGSTIAFALVGVIALVLGPVLAFPSVRTAEDFIVADLQTAAIASGALMLLTAAVFAGAELVPNPWGGSRSGGWKWQLYLLPIAFAVAGIVSLQMRIDTVGLYGSVALGAAMQVGALALYVVALVAALRNRDAAAAARAEAAATAPERHVEKLNTRVRRETAWAVSKAAAGELDRDAAADGLRQLYERGSLPAERTEAVLRQLG